MVIDRKNVAPLCHGARERERRPLQFGIECHGGCSLFRIEHHFVEREFVGVQHNGRGWLFYVDDDPHSAAKG